MGTRGFIGFVAGGVEKIGYNHSDSYPDGLGLTVLAWLRNVDGGAAADAAARLKVVAHDDEPSDEDIERLKAYADFGVGGHSERPTWYQLLRETQGQPELVLEAGAIEDASQFPMDSLFAEWGYLVDFDTNAFEVYRGFQRAAHELGRFASRGTGRAAAIDTYYPVALVASWPLDSLPTDEVFVATAEPRSTEDDD